MAAIALGAPLGAFAQQKSKVRRIGFLGAASASGFAGRVEALQARHQLREDLKAIQFHLSRPDAEPQQREEGLELCRRTAERYGLPDTSFARAALGRALPAEDRQQLAEELGELLLAEGLWKMCNE